MYTFDVVTQLALALAIVLESTRLSDRVRPYSYPVARDFNGLAIGRRVEGFKLNNVLKFMINKNWKLYEQLSLLFLERKQVVVLDVYV